jgi:hypothetical protein
MTVAVHVAHKYPDQIGAIYPHQQRMQALQTSGWSAWWYTSTNEQKIEYKQHKRIINVE